MGILHDLHFERLQVSLTFDHFIGSLETTLLLIAASLEINLGFDDLPLF